MKARELRAGDIISNGDVSGEIHMVGFGHVLIIWQGNKLPSYYPEDVFEMLLLDYQLKKEQ